MNKWHYFYLKTEENIQGIQEIMSNLDASMTTMLDTLESMKPAYAHALRMLEKSSGSSSGVEQKVTIITENTHLVYYLIDA